MRECVADLRGCVEVTQHSGVRKYEHNLAEHCRRILCAADCEWRQFFPTFSAGQVFFIGNSTIHAAGSGAKARAGVLLVSAHHTEALIVPAARGAPGLSARLPADRIDQTLIYIRIPINREIAG